LVDKALQSDGLVALLNLFNDLFGDLLEVLRGDLVQQALRAF
jgi:hypothetical protein